MFDFSLTKVPIDTAFLFRIVRKLDVVSVVTTGATIGLLTAAFTLVNSLLIRPLPFENPDQLFLVNSSNQRGHMGRISLPDIEDLTSLSTSFSSLAAFEPDVGAVMSGGPRNMAATYARVTRVGPGLLETLGVPPEVGRSFDLDEPVPVVIISHSLWHRAFSGEADAIGETIQVDGVTRVVIGVMPVGHDFYRSTELWLPLNPVGDTRRRPVGERGARRFGALARLRDNVTLREATAEVTGIAGHLSAEHPETHGRYTLVLRALDDDLRPDTAVTLWLFASVALVSLLACANVTGVQLAKAPDRSGEVAVRLSLGASRRRIMSELLVEGAVGAIPAGAIGALVGLVAVEHLAARWFSASEVGAWVTFAFDMWVFAFVVCLSLLITLFVGLVPALRLSRTPLSAVLCEQSVRSTPSRTAATWRRRMAVAQIAVTAMGSLAAILVAQSVANVRALDTGIDRVQGLRIRASLAWADGGRAATAFEQLSVTIGQVPGVTAVGLHDWRGNEEFVSTIEDGQVNDHRGPISVARVTPGFLEATGRRLVRGRLLDSQDANDRQPSVVIEESTANRLWPNENALGKLVRMADSPDEDRWRTVVGVVQDFRGLTLGLVIGIQSTRRHEYAYVPMSWDLPLLADEIRVAEIEVFVRSAADEAALLDNLRRVAAGIDPGLALRRIQTLQSYADNHTEEFLRGAGSMLTALAGIAAALSVIGLYGLLAQAARQRHREIGVRRALGCSRIGAARLIVVRGLIMAVLGSFLGLSAGVALAWIMRGFLYGVGPLNLAPILLVAIGVIGLAMLASVLPAKQAATIQPLAAIRGD